MWCFSRSSVLLERWFAQRERRDCMMAYLFLIVIWFCFLGISLESKSDAIETFGSHNIWQMLGECSELGRKTWGNVGVILPLLFLCMVTTDRGLQDQHSVSRNCLSPFFPIHQYAVSHCSRHLVGSFHDLPRPHSFAFSNPSSSPTFRKISEFH